MPFDPNSSDRGDWADDQQHGYGVQRWTSGAVYCGQWDRNKENGWGAYFLPCNPTSPHNPYNTQMIFLGRFQNGCPTDGLVIECSDFRELNTESFTIKQCEAAAIDQICRVYDVTYDGVTAFWQSPVPEKKRGLFDLKIKLCEHEMSRVDRSLAHRRSLEEIWFKWIPNPKKEKKDNTKTIAGGDEDDDKNADVETPVPKEAPKHVTFEEFYFHGTCVRDKKGQFPCPTDGTVSFVKISGSPKNLKKETLVEYKVKFNPSSSQTPTLQLIEGKAKYAIPAEDCKL